MICVFLFHRLARLEAEAQRRQAALLASLEEEGSSSPGAAATSTATASCGAKSKRKKRGKRSRGKGGKQSSADEAAGRLTLAN